MMMMMMSHKKDRSFPAAATAVVRHRAASCGTMLLLLLLLATILGSSVVAAWGREGHEIVANLAWRMLENTTKSKILKILEYNATTTTTTSPLHVLPMHVTNGHDMTTTTMTTSSSCEQPCSPLAWVADWADTVKHTRAYGWSGPLHYIDIRDDLVSGGCPADHPNTGCLFDYVRDCPNNICVAGSIVNYTNLLYTLHHSLRDEHGGGGNGDDNDDSGLLLLLLLKDSLKFLTHFIGDIHQPLHASRTSDRGGNSIHVQFLGKTKGSLERDSRALTSSRRRLRHSNHHALNLHAVWDDSIIEKCLKDDFEGSRFGLEEHLWDWMMQNETKSYWKTWLTCPYGGAKHCSSEWGEESFVRAIDWAYQNVDGTEIKNGTILTQEYHETRLPVVKERLAAGSVRLAVTLQIALEGSFESIEAFSF